MRLHHNRISHQAFFTLVKAGLWETEAHLEDCFDIDYQEVFSIAAEQSITGLVAAGLEHVVDKKIPQAVALSFAGTALQIEQRNIAMNKFVGDIFSQFDKVGICTLLVKGQGVAQCYERPLWRSCGDIDLLLDGDNYLKAKTYLSSIASSIDEEDKKRLHLGMTVGKWTVELHGTLHTELGNVIDKEIDSIQRKAFIENRCRIWKNGDVEVFLPTPDDDIIFIFTHFLQHYFHGGIGLRQICDWCRLLWKYHSSLNVDLLESRLQRMSLLPKWKAFATLAVEWLGMPEEAMPLYTSEKKWQKKASGIIEIILDAGNFGHARDMSYKQKYPVFISKFISFWVYMQYSIKQFSIFPNDAIKGWRIIMRDGVNAARKEIH